MIKNINRNNTRKTKLGWFWCWCDLNYMNRGGKCSVCGRKDVIKRNRKDHYNDKDMYHF